MPGGRLVIHTSNDMLIIESLAGDTKITLSLTPAVAIEIGHSIVELAKQISRTN